MRTVNIASATPAAEAGFCPVIRKPSSTADALTFNALTTWYELSLVAAVLISPESVLLFAGLGLLGLGAGWGMEALGICPVVKRIWTPSWVLYSGGFCFLFLAFFHAVIDVGKLNPSANTTLRSARPSRSVSSSRRMRSPNVSRRVQVLATTPSVNPGALPGSVPGRARESA